MHIFNESARVQLPGRVRQVDRRAHSEQDLSRELPERERSFVDGSAGRRVLLARGSALVWDSLYEMQSHNQYTSDPGRARSEEHTSELQSRLHLVCRLLLEKKK